MHNLPLPPEWKKVPLDEVAKIQTGLAKGKNGIVDPVDLPYLRVANVQDGFLDLAEIKTISVARSEVQRYLLQENDILLTEGGDFDKLGRGTVWRNELPVCLHQNHVFVVRVNPSVLHPDFLAYQTASPYGRWYFLSCAKQTTNLASINSTQLRNFPVLLPPLPEQRQIAAILGTWDEAIRLTADLIAAKQQRKKGLMQRLLSGEVRFAGFEGQAWRTYEIGQLLKEVRRPVAWNDDATYNLLTVRRRSEGIVLRESRRGKDIRTKTMFEAKVGDFLISKMQVVHGATALVTEEFDGMHISGSYIALVPCDTSVLDIPFFNWLSKTPEMYRKTLISSFGVHIEKMTFDLQYYLSQTIEIPPTLEQQQKISGMLAACEQEIELLKRKKEALQQQKKGLMQRLLTGQTRVRMRDEG